MASMFVQHTRFMHLKGSAQSEAKSVAFSVSLSAGLDVRRCLVLEAEPLISRPLPNQLRIPAREPEGRRDVDSDQGLYTAEISSNICAD